MHNDPMNALPRERRWRQAISVSMVPLLLGFLCFRLVSILDPSRCPELLFWTVWISSMSLSCFVAGAMNPFAHILCSAIVVGTQVVLGVVEFWASGELSAPSRSTGGVVGVALFVFWQMLLSPIAGSAGFVGSRVGRRLRAGQHR